MHQQSRPFPWTSTVPNSGPTADGKCACDQIRVNRITIENFGPDIASAWGKIPKSYEAKFVQIAPGSEWDSCVLSGSAVGDIVLSVGVPCVIPFDTDITVRPHRRFGDTNDDSPIAKLDLLVYSDVPAWAPLARSPRVYPKVDSADLSSVTETSLLLVTEYRNGVAIGVRKDLCVSGAKTVSLYFHNSQLSAISIRIIGTVGDGNGSFPISPTGYPTATPTYLTIPAQSFESYHMDVENNSFDFIEVLALSTAAGAGLYLTHSCEVRDGF